MIRRVIVLGVLAALAFGLVTVARSVFGSNDAASNTLDTNSVPVDPTEPSSAPAPTIPEATVTVPETVPVTVAETTTTAVVDAGLVPTAADPARIYIVGDSDAGAFAPYLEKLIRNTGVGVPTLDYKSSTGLSRPDFFDWPARLGEQLPIVNPDIVIVSFGGNDGQGLWDHGGPIDGMRKVDSDKWRAEYASRVGAAMDQLTAGGRTVIWVGIPNGPSDDFTARLKVQNEVVTAEAPKHAGVVFVDTWNLFTGLDGGYAEYVTDPRDGINKDVRGKDGFHLNTNGAEILAIKISQKVVEDLLKRGATI